jgi:hypothetical protein
LDFIFSGKSWLDEVFAPYGTNRKQQLRVSGGSILNALVRVMDFRRMMLHSNVGE